MNPDQKKRRSSYNTRHRAPDDYVPPVPLSELGRLIFDLFSVSVCDPVVQMPIPPEMFRKLLFLCHPDKHEGSEMSSEVTRWLLEERRKKLGVL